MTTDHAPPRRNVSRPRGSAVLWIVLPVLGVGGAAVLFLFNPSEYPIYPVCLFHKITGLQCPGCGGTRALFNLLHGRVLTALHCNALVVFAVPVLAVAGVRWLVREIAGLSHPPLNIRPVCVWLCVAAVLIFTILRNLPFAPFNLLAPP